MCKKLIVFDLGKVVFDYDVNIISNSLSKYSPKKSLFDNMETFMFENEDLFVKYEKGLISSSDFYKEIIKILDIKNLSFEKFSDIWNDIFTPISEVIDLIISLSDKYELAMLSNTNDLHFNFLYQKYSSLFLKFKKLHLSYLMNARKPDAEIYEKVLKYHNIEPHNMFFTDDNEENISAAKAMGIQAFSFKDITKLKHDLKSFGIEI